MYRIARFSRLRPALMYRGGYKTRNYSSETPGVYMRTLLRPKRYRSEEPTVSFDPRTVLLAATPNHLAELLDGAESLRERNPHLTVVGCIVDSALGTSDAVSELWSSESVTVAHSTEASDEPAPVMEIPDSVKTVSGRKTWKLHDTNFTIAWGSTLSLGFRPANTLFVNGLHCTLFYMSPDSSRHSYRYLSELTVQLPAEALVGSADPVVTIRVDDETEPLFPDGEPLTITSCHRNMIKAINGTSPAAYLENHELIKELRSKETEVFATIFNEDSSQPHQAATYRVLAGGGGWGSKSHMLALSPEAELQEGQRIEFSLLRPERKLTRSITEIPRDTERNHIVLETMKPSVGFGSGPVTSVERRIVSNVFSAGSETAFYLNGLKHDVPGEVAYIDTKR